MVIHMNSMKPLVAPKTVFQTSFKYCLCSSWGRHAITPSSYNDIKILCLFFSHSFWQGKISWRDTLVQAINGFILHGTETVKEADVMNIYQSGILCGEVYGTITWCVMIFAASLGTLSRSVLEGKSFGEKSGLGSRRRLLSHGLKFSDVCAWTRMCK